MTVKARVVLAAAAGAAAWSPAEYALHRYVLHGSSAPSRVVGSEHRRHHREPLATNPWLRSLTYPLMGAVAAVACAPLWRRSTGVAAAATGGFVSGYAVYEQLHWRMHHRPARTAAGRVLRQRHDRHHRGGPGGNFGVTSPLWDAVLGSELPR